MSDDVHEELARMKAQTDQSIAATVEFVGQVRSYYVEAVEQGFTEEQALRLTIAWQQAMFNNAQKPDA